MYMCVYIFYNHHTKQDREYFHNPKKLSHNVYSHFSIVRFKDLISATINWFACSRTLYKWNQVIYSLCFFSVLWLWDSFMLCMYISNFFLLMLSNIPLYEYTIISLPFTCWYHCLPFFSHYFKHSCYENFYGGFCVYIHFFNGKISRSKGSRSYDKHILTWRNYPATFQGDYAISHSHQ